MKLRFLCRGGIVAAISVAATTVICPQSHGQTWVNNRTGTSTFNFSAGGVPISMADPTVLVLSVNGVETYYTTGTTDDHRTGNFAIYKSTNLASWSFHKTAFDGGLGVDSWGNPASMNVPFPPTLSGSQPATLYERTTCPPYTINGGAWAISLGGRWLTHLWSPHLWTNPNGLDPNVYLTYTAAELRSTVYGSLEQLSIMVSTMPKTDFINGTGFFSAPYWFYYKVNNSGSTVYADGGAANGSTWTIPGTTSADPGYAGWNTHLLSGWEHTARPDARTNLTDAPFVFFDAGDSSVPNRPWLLYTCAQYKSRPTSTCEACGLATGDFHGANSAAFPLSTASLFDAGFSSTIKAPIDLFHRFNDWNRPPCVTCPGQACINAQYVGFPYNAWYAVPNGAVQFEPANYCAPQWMIQPITVGSTPTQYYFGGYAEGPAALYYQNRYYLFVTRNSWSGPGYMETYRVINDSPTVSLKDTGLTSPTDRSIYEDVLVASDWFERYGGGRDPFCQRSYGGSEVFLAKGKPYMVFHALTKEPAPTDPNTRRIYFKELTVQASGKFKRLYEPNTSPVTPADQDLSKFLIP